MTSLLLPPAAFAELTTHRLARPELVLQGSGAQAAGFDAGQVFCCPKPEEPQSLYTTQSRTELADRYGGIGAGMAGGSGRCSSYGSLQTKGVGVTPLVAPNADAHHSSGTMTLTGALEEALFGEVFQLALPFGALPVHAVLTTERLSATGRPPAEARALAVRPLVARPAHFLRNLLNPDGRAASGAQAPGLTCDADRVRLAMAFLATNLQLALRLDMPGADEAEILDAGLKELVRRLAWQFAAGFAKRLPHGSMSCSNLALSGAYLDFGLSSFVPAYRRICWANGQDSWTESLSPVRTLVSLRRQLDCYRPSLRTASVISADDMAIQFGQHLQQRLAVEMAKMAGLTEDMAQACPADLLAAWLTAMRDIFQRGADERFVVNPGAMADGAPAPAPRRSGRYDLNAVLSVAAPCVDGQDMDRALAPLLDDPALRLRFVRAAVDVRHSLLASAGDAGANLAAYLGAQAERKNTVLDGLQRDTWFRTVAIRRIEDSADADRIHAVMDETLAWSRHVLSDLHPWLPGANGLEQLQAWPASGLPAAELQAQVPRR